MMLSGQIFFTINSPPFFRILPLEWEEVQPRKEASSMTELERKILQTFAEAFPGMTEAEKDRLLCFGEGMATMADARTQPRAS